MEVTADPQFFFEENRTALKSPKIGQGTDPTNVNRLVRSVHNKDLEEAKLSP